MKAQALPPGFTLGAGLDTEDMPISSTMKQDSRI